MTIQKYKFISDPGHGWLRVPLLEIIKLGIADKISTCSYIDWAAKFAYLEEDCDMWTFTHAKKWDHKNLSFYLSEEHQENCPIRNMQPFPGQHLADHIEMVTL